MAIAFAFGAINVNSQNTECVISVGETQVNGWAAHRKANNGNGFYAGNILNIADFAIINDMDAFDTPVGNVNASPSIQNQCI